MTAKQRPAGRKRGRTVPTNRAPSHAETRAGSESDRRPVADGGLTPEALLQAVIDTVPGQMIVIDRDFRIVLANRAACQVVGADAVAKGLTYYQSVHGRDPARGESAPPCPVEDVIRSKTPVTVTQSHRDARGNESTAAVTATPILDTSGEVARIVIWSRDVTQRKRADEEKAKLEAQLRQAQKMEAVGQFASSIAHDFNNILTAILGNVELMAAELEPELPPDDMLVTGLAQIDRAGRRAAALTQQLLAFRRPQAAEPQVLDPNEVIRDIEEMLRSLLDTRFTLEVSLEPGLEHVYGDAVQIEQIVMNLVFHARDAMPNGGALTLETANVTFDESWVNGHPGAKLGPHVVIGVRDTGSGMDEETRARALEPFFAAEPVVQRPGPGLSTVYGIVRQAGGYITIDSEVGRGTTFRVYLPASGIAADELS
ncbi:MAG: PAS domain-containing protein [Planctomycetes bacterium]|nr:PAS domain-containing protein [Planctomycetota bacterium]